MSTLRRLPTGLVVAFVLPCFTLALHVAGLRDWVSVISGTPVPGVSEVAGVAGGAIYLVAWIATVILSPALIVASGIDWLAGRVFSRPREDPRRGAAPDDR